MSHDHTDFTLLKAALDLTSSLDLTAGLQNFVNQACALTSSPHAALAVLDTWGATTLQLEHHDSRPAPEVPEALTTAIPVASPLLVNSPADAPDLDLPADTPPFLGVSVLVHEQVYGRLYLTGKPGGYTSEDAAVVAALAPAAGIAVENAHLYADSKRTARWISASQSLTTTMLEGADEEEALELIAKTVRDVSHADTAIIVLQSVGDTWAAEITDGKNASALLGLTFPPEGRAMSVLHEGTGMIVDSMSRAQTMRVPQLAAFGSALYAPLRSRGVSSGVLILLRQIGAPEFDASLTRDEASALLARAGLDEWIAPLPEGIDTTIGSGGTTVSGGERRRLLMARALAAPAPIMAIDEASEHLDAATADRLMDTLLAPSPTHATLVVTHRLSALDQADHVLVLAAPEPGACARVAARGTHADVLDALPAYRWALDQEEQ